MTIKLRPFDKPTPPPPQQWEGHLKLEQWHHAVELCAVYPNGDAIPGGRLLVLSLPGIGLHLKVNESLGFALDKAGRLMLSGEPDYPARIAELEAEVARLKGSEAPPDKGAWRATEEDRNRGGVGLRWYHIAKVWKHEVWERIPTGSWVREQPPPPPGGGAWEAYMTPVRPRPMMPNPDTEPKR